MDIKKYFSGLSKNIYLLAAISLLADISTESLYPVLPVFLTQTLSAPATAVGVVEGIAQASQYLIQGISGAVADKIKNRKLVALVGYGLGALGKPLIGLSAIWPQVLIGRTLDRLGSGTRSAPRDSLISNSVTPENRGRAFGFEGIGDNLGAVIGPLLAILLLFHFHVDLRFIFFFAFLPGTLAFIAMLFVNETKTSPHVPSPKVQLDRLPKAFWLYLLVTAIFSLGNFSNAFLILRARNIGVPLELTIFVYALFNLAAAISSFPSGSLFDKLGGKTVLSFLFLILVITYLGFANSQSIPLVITLFVFYGLFQGGFRTVGKALATDFIPPDIRAFGLGLYMATIGLANLGASLAAGIFWDKINSSFPFWYGAALAIIALFALNLLVPKKSTF